MARDTTAILQPRSSLKDGSNELRMAEWKVGKILGHHWTQKLERFNVKSP